MNAFTMYSIVKLIILWFKVMIFVYLLYTTLYLLLLCSLNALLPILPMVYDVREKRGEREKEETFGSLFTSVTEKDTVQIVFRRLLVSNLKSYEI